MHSSTAGSVTNEAEPLGTPALPAALELAKFAYEDLVRTTDSVNTRIGVSLTLLSAVLATLAVRISSLELQVLGSGWLVYFVAFLGGIVLIAIGATRLFLAMLTTAQRSPYSVADLGSRWTQSLEEFQKQSLSDFRAAFEERKGQASRKAINYDRGLQTAFIGVGVIVFLEMLHAAYTLGVHNGAF